jgi:hypothetical protein
MDAKTSTVNHCQIYWAAEDNARAVAFTIAREVIVAPLVPSTPRTVWSFKIACSVSVSAL